MAAPAPSDKVKEREYTNWLKVTLALYYMKSGLHTFIQSEIDCLHQFLIQKIYAGQTVQLSNCTTCHVGLVRRKKQTWKFQNQCTCKLSCDVWFRELLALHSNPNSEKIYWANSDVSSWSSKPWECAKVFLPRGQQPTNIGPAESDAQALMVLLANCTHFHPKLSQQGQTLAHTISKIRNKVIHDGGMKVSDADRMSFIQQIIQLLEDPTSLKSLEDCKAAVDNIHKIDNDSVDVLFNVGLEMTVLRAVVKELRQELGMQEKKNVDSVDSLKEEFRQLREQLTKRFEDAEKKLELHGENTQKMFEDVKKELEFHGERLGTVEENVELHRERLGAVEEIVELHRERLGAVEENIELHRERLGAVEEKVVKLQNVEENILKLQEEIGQITRENNSCMKEIPTKRRQESDGLRQLKNQTEDNLDTFRKMGFIPTTQTEEAKKLLQEKRSIVIKGNPGEGKTSTALHLIDNDDYRNQRVVVSSPKQWKKVDTDWVKIVVLEDMFGQYDLDPGHLQEWLDDYLRSIQKHVDVGKLQVIITIRDDILKKAYSKLNSFKLFMSDMSLTLSSEKLKNSDKMSILNRELQRNNKDMNIDEKEQCIANFSGLIGFPQCSSLFAGDKDLFGQGPKFFKSPEKFLVDNITNLKPNSFLSLAFLFCIGEIEEEYLSPSQIQKSENYLLVLEELALYLNGSFNESTMISLRQSYDHLSALYVNKVFLDEHHSGGNVNKPFIQFSHATIYEAVGQVLGDRCPEMVVKYGELGYLYQRTYTAEAKENTSWNVFIPVSVYGLLAERMVHDVVIGKQLVETIVNHSAFKQYQFLMTLKDELHKGNRIRDFLMAKTFLAHLTGKDLSAGICFTFLQCILQSDEDVVRLVYSHLLEFLACTHNDSSNCWQCEEKQDLLELALYYHHFEIADKLITMNAKYTLVSLCNAARHGDLSRVQIVLEYLKRSLVFDPECIEAEVALCRAYISGNQDVIEILLQKGITLDSKHVANVVQHGDINVLMKVVEHLKCHNKWNPHQEQYKTNRYFHPQLYRTIFNTIELLKMFPFTCSIALYITYCNEKFDMADYLLENEAKVSMHMLPYVSEHSSQKAVARVIQHLKVTGTWNYHYDDASEALEKAYNGNKYDVCDLLVQEGVTLKMNNLCGVIMRGFQVLLESVRKAIQHLKDTDSWDPKCNDASKVLVKAYSKQKHDVCDLLVQEGVPLTMKHLPYMIRRSLDYVKMSVKQLKDTDSWDPKCDDASEALEKAFSKKKYDVCDLLIQEGVSLTRKNLTSIITRECLGSLESVKKIIQHLKDTDNWDPKCGDASEALEKAYWEHEHDVCDLLVQEGVSLSMKNLPGVIRRGILLSLESVKKAIQHLKDSDRWDPKCDDASEALDMAYGEHMYSVGDLLVQEGVSLTMKHLPHMILRSLDYLKTSVKQLKDTDSWDPKCDDASEALEKAYSEKKYDVCDLLIQEGVSLTRKNLPGVIRRGILLSLESVKKAIQHLKDSDRWDPKCDDASEALDMAYGEHMYSVGDLLVQKRVSLSMKNLPGVIRRRILLSLESVKQAIQHLKDSDRWDPKCDDASEALEMAYGEHMYSVGDLLVQEGVSLTMKHLPHMILRSLDYLKTSVKQLKDTDSWDPKCDDASEALEKAYSEKKYDVCDLLIREGVSLTMKSLPILVLDSNLESASKAIQHLKDTNQWDSLSDYAVNSLTKAKLSGKTDQCNLLIKERVYHPE